MPDYDWDEVRRRWEGGEVSGSIAKDTSQPSRRTIDYRAKRQGWKVPHKKRVGEYAQGRRPADKHGLNTMKRAMKELGKRSIDGRTTRGKALVAYRADLIDALGGEGCVTPQKLTIIDRAVIPTAFMLSSVDAYLMDLGDAIVSKRYRKLFPIVEQRQKMADALVNYLVRLGLERQRAPVFDIDQYSREVAGEEDTPAKTIIRRAT